jgi:hypothetical protein
MDVKNIDRDDDHQLQDDVDEEEDEEDDDVDDIDDFNDFDDDDDDDNDSSDDEITEEERITAAAAERKRKRL